jgi:hypothetical protein
MRITSVLSLSSLIAILLAPVAAVPPASKPFSFTNIVTGNISSYHFIPGPPPVWKNDASGAALVNGVIILVDDLMSSVRMYREGESEAAQGIMYPLHVTHSDLEGATTLTGTLVITCSMSGKTDQSFNLLSQYDVDPTGPSLAVIASVNMRSQILNAIQTTLGAQDPTWFAHTQMFSEKDGNLNVEGISVTASPSQYDLVWGLRSPLFAHEFATPTTSTPPVAQFLDHGKAILVFVKDAFSSEPSFDVKTLDLQGQGIRSIEHVPSLQGYLIVSGPVPKADSYRLWLWRPTPQENDVLVDITNKLPEFLRLGRPEAILKRSNDNITIISEQDPTFTTPPPYNFIEATIADD